MFRLLDLKTCRRPVFGGAEKFQTDPYRRDNILFYEYFHGDNGAGLGASHQTGWTGLIARLTRICGALDAKTYLEAGKHTDSPVPGTRAGIQVLKIRCLPLTLVTVQIVRQSGPTALFTPSILSWRINERLISPIAISQGIQNNHGTINGDPETKSKEELIMGEMRKEKLNGIDTEALKRVMKQVSEDPSAGKLKFQVTTTWKGATRSETVVQGYEIGGQKVKRVHTFAIDEPKELLGEDTAGNPQEYLMGAMNACILNTYVIAAAMKGIRLDKVEMETEGELDLRGFLGIDKKVIPGYRELKYKVRLKGNGTREQYEEVHKTVIATSPNYYNLAHAVKLNTEFIFE